MSYLNSAVERLAARAYDRCGSTAAIRADLLRQEEFARGIASAMRVQDEPDIKNELASELEWAHLLISEDRAALAGLSTKINLVVASSGAHCAI